LGTPGSEDPRRGRLFATALEDFVACPWQGVLTRFLDVGPVPDPLEEVPQADERLAGILVHRVLEAALREVLPARGGMVRDVARREPEVMPWPGEEVIARLSRREASRLLEEEGIRLPGLAELLAIRVEPYLDIARRTDWASGGPSVVGAEVEGWTEVAGRRIGFRADRADLVEGRLVLTDYKTGKPFADVKSPDLRRAKLRDRVAHGKSLQAVAYAQAQEVDAATGRYLFLGPGPADEVRSVQVRDFDEEVTAAFETTVKALLDALEAGALFPRLVEPDKDREPDRCRTCRVKEACVRGESGDRGRLSRFAATAEGPFAALWRLPGGK
jgi:hypothetical protein